MTISDATIEEIKNRVVLSDVVAQHGIDIRVSGSSKKACCPFHREKTPSFNINDEKGFYHCFGCGESGDVIEFVQKMDGLPFVDAVKQLASQCGVKIEEREDPNRIRCRRLYALMEELAQFYHRCLKQIKEASLARDYLKSRELDEKICDDFLIGYAPNGIRPILKWAEIHGYTVKELEDAGIVKPSDVKGKDGFHRFGGRLMFSVRDRYGRVVAFSGRQLVENKNSGKYVNSPETIIFKKSQVLFGFDRAAANITKSPHHEAIVCEGQIDTIRLHVAGFPIAVASQGTAFTEDHVRALKRVADQVVLVFDDDAAGHKATIRTAALFLEAEMPVKVVSLPNGEDPDSFLRKNGANAFSSCLEAAESIITFQARAERAKEDSPSSVEANMRVAKALLLTISSAKSSLMRETLLNEASTVLLIPKEALKEKLTAILNRQSSAKPIRPTVLENKSSTPVTQDKNVSVKTDVGDATFEIPNVEVSFCKFIMSKQKSPLAKRIVAAINTCLPSCVFEHILTRRFVKAWVEDSISEKTDSLSRLYGEVSEDDSATIRDILLSAGDELESDMDGSALVTFVRDLVSRFAERKIGMEQDDSNRRNDIVRAYKIARRGKMSAVNELFDTGVFASEKKD